MHTIRTPNGMIFNWDNKVQGWRQQSGNFVIKAQRVNVGKEWESINYDLYYSNGQYYGPVAERSIEFI